MLSFAPSIEPGLAGFLVCLAGELTGGLRCGDVPRHQPIFLMDFPRNKPSIFGVPQFTETPKCGFSLGLLSRNTMKYTLWWYTANFRELSWIFSERAAADVVSPNVSLSCKVSVVWPRQVRRNKFILQFVIGNCRFLAALCTLGLVVSVPKLKEKTWKNDTGMIWYDDVNRCWTW